jgi:tetratricopeptide (TPR) repeat protein
MLGAIDRLLYQPDGARGVVVHGESGAGKSALLANVAHRYATGDGDAFVVEHYVGAGSAGSSHLELITRIIAELKARYDLPAPLPTTADAIEESFSTWLASLGRNACVLVIDGLCQLRPPVIRWLPSFLPPSVRIIASTSDPQQADRLGRAGWARIEMPPLDAARRRDIASAYIAARKVELPTRLLEEIVRTDATTNPLFLRTTVDEIHASTSDPEMDTRIDTYLRAGDLSELFDRILERHESRFGADVVRDTLAALAVSRAGLSIDELRCAVGADGDVDGLVDAMSVHLATRDGRIGYAHESWARTVDRRYLSDEARAAARRRIVRCFNDGAYPRRAAEELLWQYRELGDAGGLLGLLTSPAAFATLIDAGRTLEVYQAWTSVDPELGAIAAISQRASALSSMGRAQEASELSGALASFLMLAQRHDLAIPALRCAVDEGRDVAALDVVIRLSVDLVRALVESGRYDDARTELATLEALAEANDADAATRATILSSIASLENAVGEFARAETYYLRAVALRQSAHGESRAEIDDLISYGAVLYSQSRHAEAREATLRCIADATRRLGEHDLLVGRAWNNLAAIEAALGDLSAAADAQERALAIETAVLGASHPETAVLQMNLGFFAKCNGDFATAERCYREALRIHRAVSDGDSPVVATDLLNLGSLLIAAGDFARALEASEEAVAMRRRLLPADNPHVTDAEIQMARCLGETGRLDEALAIYRRLLPLRRRQLGPSHELTQRTERTMNDFAARVAQAGESG